MEEERQVRGRVARRLCAAQIQLVARVYEALKDEKTKGHLKVALGRPFDRAIAYTGLSRPSVGRIVAGQTGPPCGVPAERQGGGSMTDEEASWIRPVIVNLVIAKIPRTLDTILAELKSQHPEWRFGRTTLWRTLTRLNFRFVGRRDGRYERLREEPGNVGLRSRYLANYFDFLNQNRPHVFLDETWLSQNMVTSKCWSDGRVDIEDKVPSGKGKRWIVLAACEARISILDERVFGGGWVPNSWRMWKGKVQKEDYHSEMNGEVFEHWVHHWLLPNVSRNAVIVMDRAPYHLMLTDESKGCPSGSTREQMAHWLVDHGARNEEGTLFTLDMLLNDECSRPCESGKMRRSIGLPRDELAKLCTLAKPAPVYKIHEWLKKWNSDHETDIRLNLLPVAHPQLNPIELAWAQLKQFGRSSNAVFRMPEVQRLALQKKESLSTELWQSLFWHAHKYAVDSFRSDEIIAESELEEGSALEYEENSEEDDEESDEEEPEDDI